MRYAEFDVTTNFSFLRGGSHPEELVATAKALGLAAIAVTDRNTLAGVVRAHLAAKELAGIKFIPGARLDLEDAPSLLAYPTDRAAYGQLCRLLTLGQRRAEKGKCKLLLEDVVAHAEGLIFIVVPPEDFSPSFLSSSGSTGRSSNHRSRVEAQSQQNNGYGGLLDARLRGHDKTNPLPPCGGARDHAVRAEGGPAEAQNPRLTPFPTLPHKGGGASGAVSDSDFESQLQRIKEALGGKAPLYLAASHAYRGDDRARIGALAHLAKRTGIPLVATNAVLYHTPDRRPLQDVLTCIREKCTLAEAGVRLEANAERHLKSPERMARLFAGHEEALANTISIAEACRFSLDELKYEYPDEPVPEGKTPQSHLQDLTFAGAEWRFPNGVPEKVRETLLKELALIAELNYAPYFLTVHDIVRYARSIGILCQGRGSAANSAVCYCLGITNVDPTEIELLFERFVSPERKEPPDIDVDFEHERREEVIQYIYARYGRDRAGLAATVICYRGRLAVREVGKALGLSEDSVAALATTIWGLSHSGLPNEYVRQAGLDPSDPLIARCLALTKELIGFPRHLSQHVGGFVLTRGPLSEVVPIGNAAMEDRTVIEWDKDDLDALGLLKVDVLGLGMLTCIRKAFSLLKEHYGRDLSLGTLPREDPAVYDMLCNADSIGVFQVESRAQMNMLPRLRPRKFYDLVIEVAIVRPGPIQGDMVHPYLRRRAGLEAEDYPSPHPDHGPADELRQVLGKTMGVPLFQEQAMRLAMVAAKFSGPEANELRRAMATFRRRGTIDRLRDKMVGRMTARGYPADFAERCFNQIKGFGEYGFPESHAASFAHLVYVSAWIKCHYPAVFAAALLNSQPMGFYAPAQIVRCAREHGVEAREVDVNHSLWDCTLEPCSDLPLPPCGGAREHEGRAEGGKPQAQNPLLTPLPTLPHKGGGEISGAASKSEFADPNPSPSSFKGREKNFALRLGLRQIDGFREADAQTLVSVRDGIPAENNPHLFAPPLAPYVPLPPCGGAREDKVRAEGGKRKAQNPLLTPLPTLPHKEGGRACAGSANSRIPPLDGEGGEAEGRAGWGNSGIAHPPPGASMRADLPTRGRYGEIALADEYRDVRDLWRRSGLKRASLERLAAADACRSLGLDRREALWEVRGLPKEAPLPLFDGADVAETGAEAKAALPVMPLSEHVVNDYRTLRLSLKAHPMSFLRTRFASERILACADLKTTRDGARVSVAGVVLVRQRPGSAEGVVFMTLEDETGVANAVIWPKVLERERKVVMAARLVVVHGRVQRHEDIIHVVAARLEDRSSWLRLLDEEGERLSLPIAHGDHVKHAGGEDSRERIRERGHPRWHPRRHPRAERIIPKSRDFH